MAHTACLVCLFSTDCGCRKNLSEEQALVGGTKQNLGNILYLYNYVSSTHIHRKLKRAMKKWNLKLMTKAFKDELD